MALKIEKYFGFPFNGTNDFVFGDVSLYYIERLNDSEGGILLDVGSALKDSLKDLGETIFIAPWNSPAVVYFPAWESYIQNLEPELCLLYVSSNPEQGMDSEEAEIHRQYFHRALGEHPIGDVLLRIYDLKASYSQSRNRTLGYVRKQLEEPSLLEQFLSQTGGPECRLKQPYWTDEAGKWAFAEKFKRRLR